MEMVESWTHFVVTLCFSLLFMHLCSLLDPTSCLNLMIRVWKALLCFPRMLKCKEQILALNAKRFLFDTMCEVINLITTATEYSDTDACRKHLGLARIYGWAHTHHLWVHTVFSFLRWQTYLQVETKVVCTLNESVELQNRFELNFT